MLVYVLRRVGRYCVRGFVVDDGECAEFAAVCGARARKCVRQRLQW